MGPPKILRRGFCCAPKDCCDARGSVHGLHVPQAVTLQLRRRGVEVLTAIEDGTAEWSDDDLLDRCAGLAWLLVTFDIRFKAMAEDWQRSGRYFGGLIYAHPLRISIGHLVQDLELIAKATEPSEWINVVEHLPL